MAQTDACRWNPTNCQWASVGMHCAPWASPESSTASWVVRFLPTPRSERVFVNWAASISLAAGCWASGIRQHENPTYPHPGQGGEDSCSHMNPTCLLYTSDAA